MIMMIVKFKFLRWKTNPAPAGQPVWFHWFIIECKKWSQYRVKIGSPARLNVWFHWFLECKKWSWYRVKIGNLKKLGEINLKQAACFFSTSAKKKSFHSQGNYFCMDMHHPRMTSQATKTNWQDGWSQKLKEPIIELGMSSIWINDR